MIIGLHGESRAGKDSIAKILQDHYDFEWRQFANSLRTILLDINPPMEDGRLLRSVVAEWGWDVVKSKYPSSVEMMISLGQSVRDNIHIDAWTWGPLKDAPVRLVISDVRQWNEVNGIYSRGGQIWKIERPGTVARGMDHLIDDCDFHVVIYNTGTLEDLKVVVDSIMEGK